MPTPALERLRKILELEEKQKWRNRAVIGGMKAMSHRWLDDARQEKADAATVNAIAHLLPSYDSADQEERRQIIKQIRQILAGDLSDIEIPLQKSDSSASKSFAPDSGLSGAKANAPQPKAAPDGPIAPAEATDIAEKRVRKKRATVKANPQDLQADTQLLPGVGKVVCEQLQRVGIEQVADLLWHLPFRYEDYSQLRTISELQPGEQVTVIANLWEVSERKISMKRTMIQGILADGTGTLHATWWNKYVKKQLKIGNAMRFSGKVGLYMGQKTLDNPTFEELDEERVATGRIAPIYRLTEKLSNKRVRNLVKHVLDNYARFLTDPLPDPVRADFNLLDLKSALKQIHFPEDQEQLAAARHRLAFAEFFYIQLGALQRREKMQRHVAPSLSCNDEQLAQFHAALAFELTGAQQRVLGEIRNDLTRTIPMTRLVQGDVGSGKTAVAAAAMYIAALNGAQSALLAPTQILAEQHHRGIAALVESLSNGEGEPIRVALLTGRVTGTERAQVLEGLRDGSIDIVVGTTALIQENVQFNKLGFAVVDEQHRFGVQQRGAFRTGNEHPHLIVMSATPIPRSLALTIYGDLDLSIIDEMPPGRTPIKTRWFKPNEREKLYSFLRREVAAGRQGFIVYPLVEESEKLEAGAAIDAYERLRKEVFFNERVALLHGRMSGNEKDEVMRAFSQGEYDILVSTSVIEVGIDVPNASLIIIEDAERFGLAQLHQFRGRVGRGQHKSYCALISKGTSANAEERLLALEESNDGFVLAEKDLELRGPGDFFGTKQSGLPELRAAQLSDLETLAEARQAAQALFAEDPTLEKYPHLAKQVARFWRGHGDVS